MIITQKEHKGVSAIYLITNRESGRIYVGSAEDLWRRYYAYRWYATPGRDPRRYIQNAMQKHGFDAFEFSILELVPDKTKLIEREQYWLDHYRSYDKAIGYNVNPKADSWLGRKHTEESRRKMSQAQSGRKHSEERRRQQSIMSKVLAESNPLFKVRPVVQIDRDSLDVLNVYPSIKAASEATGVRASDIGAVCNHEYYSAKGFYWAFKEEYERNGFKRPTKANGRRVVQMTKEGVSVRVWINAFVAAQETETNAAGLYQVLYGNKRTAGGFKWRYAEANE